MKVSDCSDDYNNVLETAFKKAETWGIDPSVHVAIVANVGKVTDEYAELSDPNGESPYIMHLVVPRNPELLLNLSRKIESGQYVGDCPQICIFGAIVGLPGRQPKIEPYRNDEGRPYVKLITNSGSNKI